jgi:hypothetical protein
LDILIKVDDCQIVFEFLSFLKEQGEVLFILAELKASVKKRVMMAALRRPSSAALPWKQGV